MSDSESKPPQPGPLGFLSSLTELLAATLDIASTRLELISLDLQEGFEGFVGVLLWAFIALFAAGIGLFLAALVLIFAFWDTHRVLVSILSMAGFLGLAALATTVVLSKLRAQRSLFAATLSEFAKDHERLKARP